MNLLIHSLFNRDWKLILKKEELLNGTEYLYHRLFKGTVTERWIIHYILSLDESLRLNYNACQTIVFTVTHRKPDLFRSFIHEKQRGLSAKMDQALKTFRQSERAIVNALSYDYSNGLVEGINNKIKSSSGQPMAIATFLISETASSLNINY
ncbi:transposase [Streptococcus suis]|nr:transposase [Streptococcus suis]